MYEVILCDPPWEYRDKGNAGKRGASHKYGVLNKAKLKQLDVQSLAAPNCTMFMWVTLPHMTTGLEVMKAWGFKYKTGAFVWIKTPRGDKRAYKIPLVELLKAMAEPKKVVKLGLEWLSLHWGLGHYTRSNAEIVLLGTRGKPKRVDKSVHSVVIEQHTGRHSGKPEEVHRRIEKLMGDVSRCELFAREKQPGWDVWGDEIECDFELNFKEDSDG